MRHPKYKPVDKDWVFEIVQDRLGDNQLRIALLRDFIDETQSVVCNYLNRSYVPEPLKYVIVNLTMDLLKSQALNGMINNDQLADAGIGAFASIKDGDSELKFATSKTITGAHTADVDALLYNYTSQLDKYRLLKW